MSFPYRHLHINEKKKKPYRHLLLFKLDYFFTIVLGMWNQLIEIARKVMNCKCCSKSLTRNFGKHFITWGFFEVSLSGAISIAKDLDKLIENPLP